MIGQHLRRPSAMDTRSLRRQVNEMLYAWNVAPCNSQMLNVGDEIHRVTV